MNFVILYWLTSSVLYIHYQPKIAETKICFNVDNKSIVSEDSCKPMKIARINGDVPVFQYSFNTSCQQQQCDYSYFQIIYTYSNRSSFNSSWVPLSNHNNKNSLESCTHYCFLYLFYGFLLTVFGTLVLSMGVYCCSYFYHHYYR